jgi:hypothetical protein
MPIITIEERAPDGELWTDEAVAQRVGEIRPSLVVYDRDLGEAKIISAGTHSGGVIAALVYEVADSADYDHVVAYGKAGGLDIHLPEPSGAADV